MKKLVSFFIFILLLSGCSVSEKLSKDNIGSSGVDTDNTLNQILINSGVYSKNIYNADKDITELVLAKGKKFDIPEDYELALDLIYSIEESSTSYTIKVLRQMNQTANEAYTDITQRMPEKPLIVVIAKDNDEITNLFVINSFSVLAGSMGWGDYSKDKIAKAVELKDLNNDNVTEILLHTFKGYTSDSANGLVTIYFNSKDNTFDMADKVFMATWKDSFEIVDINKKYYVLEASPGSGSCRICPTPYLVRIYQFTGDYFFDIGSVGIEKEYDDGLDALKDALPRVQKKILAGDVFTL
jgi:hypothetical protein